MRASTYLVFTVLLSGVSGYYWTSWKNTDSPRGLGDFELIGAGPKPCGGNVNAVRIEARSVGSSSTLLASSHRIALGPSYGLRCIGSGCSDFRVRYSIWLTGDVVDSNWYDERNPNIFGDYEKITLHGSLANTPEMIMWRISFQTVPASLSKGYTKRRLDLGPKYGLQCVKASQRKDWGCVDYEVRYRCPGFGIKSRLVAPGR